MSVHFRIRDQLIVVYGKTYEQRALLKSLGGRFNGENKSWQIPYSETSLDRIKELCRTCGGGQLPTISSGEEVATQEQPTQKQPAQEQAGLTIAELLRRIDVNLKESFPYPVWVVGEVQNLSQKENFYFQLVEAQEGKKQTLTVNAVIWRERMQLIREPEKCLQDGLKIRCLCIVQLYRERGAISLQVLDIDPSYTRGELAIAREDLLRKIRAAGQENVNKSLTPPRVLQSVGLITAAKSRAYSDFCHQLETLHIPLQVHFRPSPMQGEEVLVEVPSAITELSHCDVIVITRGGGSASDLRWFDSPEVAAGVINSQVPIIAAIGHHEDLCVAEEISYMRQKTPTAAADYLGQIFMQLSTLLQNLAYELIASLEQKMQDMQARYMQARAELGIESLACLRRGEEKINQMLNDILAAVQEDKHRRQSQLAELGVMLAQGAMQALSAKLDTLQELEKNLLAEDPRLWLRKGWAKVSTSTGPLTSIKQLANGDLVTAGLQDGKAELRVAAVYPATVKRKQ